LKTDIVFKHSFQNKKNLQLTIVFKNQHVSVLIVDVF
jgi:hypothetical protein